MGCESDYATGRDAKSKADRNFTLTQKVLRFSKDNFLKVACWPQGITFNIKISN